MDSKMKIDEFGTKCRYNEKGQFHQEDGPAVEYTDGHKEWWVNGKRHREDGPAVIWSNGDKTWWINGQLHRLDGPTVVRAEGYKTWCINLSISYNPIMDNA